MPKHLDIRTRVATHRRLPGSTMRNATLTITLISTITITACTEWHIDITTSTMTGNDTSQVTLVTHGVPSDATGDASDEDSGATPTSDSDATSATTNGLSETTSGTTEEPTTGAMAECPRTQFCGVRDCDQSGLPDMDELGDCGVLEQVCLMWEFPMEFCGSLASQCVAENFNDGESCQGLLHWGEKLHICGDEEPVDLLDECLCFLSCTAV